MSDGAPLRTLPEVIAWIRGPGEFVVGNPVTRTWAVADGAFLELLSELDGETDEAELRQRLNGRAFRARDACRSRFADGLVGDPTGLDRSATLDGAPELPVADALELARRITLATENEDAYVDSLGPRRSLLDRGHHGNLHQQVGEYVLLELRQASVDEWWIEQKFTEDRRQPRPGLYRSVQWPFVSSYFDEERLRERRVLDFGCGPGLFTRLFASRGASVVGTDISADHLTTAARLSEQDGLTERTEYVRLEQPPEVGVPSLAERHGRFDLIFLSDVLMFYFYPYDPSQQLDAGDLLTLLKGLLTQGGTIGVLEPTGTFWQQPWLGSERRPLTIISEYRNRRYGVTPTLERMSQAAEKAELVIGRVRELTPPEGAPGGRGEAYAAEFPVWWYCELRTG